MRLLVDNQQTACGTVGPQRSRGGSLTEPTVAKTTTGLKRTNDTHPPGAAACGTLRHNATFEATESNRNAFGRVEVGDLTWS